MPGYKDGPKPIMRMYGVTNGGNSVLCHVHGFVPYFFIQAPSQFKPEDCGTFQNNLNAAILADMRSNKDNVSQVNIWLLVFLWGQEHKQGGQRYQSTSTKLDQIWLSA